LVVVAAASPAIASPSGGVNADGTAGSPASIRVHGRTVLELVAPGPSGTSPADRAAAASTILAAALEEGGEPKVEVSSLDGSEDHLLLRVGNRDLLRLGPQDIAASGLSPAVYGESVRARVESFLRDEGHRGRIRELVLSVCMVVLLGLLSFLALGYIGNQRNDLRRWLENKAQAERPVRGVLIISREGLASVAYVLATSAALLAQFAIILGYCVFVLSQFALTRGWIGPLLQALLSPFGDLLQRFSQFLPSALVAVACFYVLVGAIRVLRFFLYRVSTKQLAVSWLPADLASPMQPLLEAAVVVVTILVVSPLVAGSHSDLFLQVGLLALGALGLAALPVGATLLTGAFCILSRRYALGQWIEVGPHQGELTEITLFELRLVPLDAGMVRVPHLRALLTPVRQLPGPPLLEIDLWLGGSVHPTKAMEAISLALTERFGQMEISVRSLDAAAIGYRLRWPTLHRDRRSEVLVALSEAMARAGIPLASQPGSHRSEA
jgi:small-conductance mechanosensitive channel